MVERDEKYWKEKLSPEEYRVLREKGTEPAFDGALTQNKADGFYHCAGCDKALFKSTTKYDSGSGWPSFFEPIDKNSVKEILDKSHGMLRTEIVCSGCEGHLGHLFTDGPQPTGLRYCINSVSLKFEQKEQP